MTLRAEDLLAIVNDPIPGVGTLTTPEGVAATFAFLEDGLKRLGSPSATPRQLELLRSSGLDPNGQDASDLHLLDTDAMLDVAELLDEAAELSAQYTRELTTEEHLRLLDFLLERVRGVPAK